MPKKEQTQITYRYLFLTAWDKDNRNKNEIKGPKQKANRIAHTWLTAVAREQNTLHSNRQQTGVVHRETRAAVQSQAVETGGLPATAKQQVIMECIHKKKAVRSS